MGMDGRALSAIGIGTLLVWSGIKGWSVLGSVKDIIAGGPPNPTVTYPLTVDTTDPFAAGGVGASASGQLHSQPNAGIVGLAMAGVGHAYHFGGAPGKDGTKPWDCSSMVNFIVGVKMGAPIPGYGAGRYDGTTHGPATGQWAFWSGLQRVPRASVMAGDIVVWAGHMGIATANNEMVSAQNDKDGTRVSKIDGFGTGPLLMTGRLK